MARKPKLSVQDNDNRADSTDDEWSVVSGEEPTTEVQPAAAASRRQTNSVDDFVAIDGNSNSARDSSAAASAGTERDPLDIVEDWKEVEAQLDRLELERLARRRSNEEGTNSTSKHSTPSKAAKHHYSKQHHHVSPPSHQEHNHHHTGLQHSWRRTHPAGGRSQH